MSETITVTLESDVAARLKAKARTSGESPEAMAARLLGEAVSDGGERGSPSLEEFQSTPWVREFVARYAPDPERVLGCGLTVRQYLDLSDEEQEALWDEGFLRALDEDQEPEREVNPDARPAGQRRGTKGRRGAHPYRSRDAPAT